MRPSGAGRSTSSTIGCARRERELLGAHRARGGRGGAAHPRPASRTCQRRQIEQVERIVERATSRTRKEATQQFAELVKAAREEAARRLSRELDRAVEVFAREAEAVLAERLAHVGDAGASGWSAGSAEVAKSLERQRDEWMPALDERIADLEADVRQAARGARRGRRGRARRARGAAPGADAAASRLPTALQSRSS